MRGSLDSPQGLKVLVDAAARLDAAAWEIWIAGDGPEREILEEEVIGQGLRHVRCFRYVDANRLMTLYAQADILYAQLRPERGLDTAQPTKVLDHMAAGRPIIYGGNGPASELLRSSGAGLVIDADDPEALVETVGRLTDPQLRRRMAAARREHVSLAHRRAHGIKAFMDRLEQYLRHGRPGRPSEAGG